MTTLLISAGDASGDLHAADFVRSFRELQPQTRFVGLGGDEMERAGVELVVHQRALAVGGLLEDEGLAAVASRRAGTFSRGMAQRLAIARALIQDPPLLLLDEPFAGLDRRAGDRLSQRLGRLRGAGRALVLVTHDLARAADIADAALVLSAGRVVYRAEGEELARGRLDQLYARALETPPGSRGAAA